MRRLRLALVEARFAFSFCVRNGAEFYQVLLNSFYILTQFLLNLSGLFLNLLALFFEVIANHGYDFYFVLCELVHCDFLPGFKVLQLVHDFDSVCLLVLLQTLNNRSELLIAGLILIPQELFDIYELMVLVGPIHYAHGAAALHASFAYIVGLLLVVLAVGVTLDEVERFLVGFLEFKLSLEEVGLDVLVDLGGQLDVL